MRSRLQLEEENDRRSERRSPCPKRDLGPGEVDDPALRGGRFECSRPRGHESLESIRGPRATALRQKRRPSSLRHTAEKSGRECRMHLSPMSCSQTPQRNTRCDESSRATTLLPTDDCPARRTRREARETEWGKTTPIAILVSALEKCAIRNRLAHRDTRAAVFFSVCMKTLRCDDALYNALAIMLPTVHAQPVC